MSESAVQRLTDQCWSFKSLHILKTNVNVTLNYLHLVNMAAILDAILDFEKKLQGDFRGFLVCDFTQFSGPILKITACYGNFPLFGHFLANALGLFTDCEYRYGSGSANKIQGQFQNSNCALSLPVGRALFLLIKPRMGKVCGDQPV